MKFAIAPVTYWDSIGFDTTEWRKSLDGTKAICHLEYAEKLGANLHANPQVQIIDSVDPNLKNILESSEWVIDGTNGDLDSFSFLTKLNQFETKVNDAVSQKTADLTAQLQQKMDNPGVSLASLKGVKLGNAPSYLNIPTYDGSNQIVHAKVLYFKDGWNGYKFWMGHTPLPYIPAVDESKENPSMMCSHDGENWITPAGLTNPLDVPTNYPNDYHSDAHLVYIPTTNTLELWYRQYIKNPRTEIIWRRTSTDGVVWTPREEVMRSNGTENLIVSPAVIFDEGKYKIWFVSNDGGIYKLAYYESYTGLNPTLIRKMTLSNQNLGHCDVIRTARGYEAVIHIRGDQTCEYYFSHDNINWTTGTTILSVKAGSWDNTKLYRPNITVVGNDYYLYYSGGLSTVGVKVGLIKIKGIENKISADYVESSQTKKILSTIDYNVLIQKLMNLETAVINSGGTIPSLNPNGIINIVKDNLILWLDGDFPGSSPLTKWKDWSGNDVAVDLFNYSVNSFSDGKLSFSGNRQIAKIPTMPNFYNQSLTINFKIKTAATKGRLFGGEYTDTVMIPVPSDTKVVFWRGGQSFEPSTNEARLGVISDIVFTHDIVTKVVQLYINGKLVSSAILNTTDTITTGPLWIGQGGVQENNWYTGDVYSVKIYNRVLTPEEIEKNYLIENSRNYLS